MSDAPTAPYWSASVGGVRVLFGEGRLAQLGDVVADLGVERILLVSDPGVTAAGHVEPALESLTARGLEVGRFDQIDENPTGRHVAAGAEVAAAFEPQAIAALGGGSVMDCAKAINLVHTNGGEIELYRGYNRAERPLLPAVAVPTTAGTGSDSQSYAIIGRTADHRKMACGDEKALFRSVVLDPRLVATCPRSVAATSGLDAVAHALESHVSATANPISRIYSLAAWSRLSTHLEPALAGDHRAVGEMMIGAHLAGAAIEQSMLGAAHGLTNPLTAELGVTHGVGLAIVLPHVIRFNRSAVEDEYRELAAAAALDPTDPVEALASRVEARRRVAGLPGRLRELEIDRDLLPVLAQEAANEWTTGNNPRVTTPADLAKIYDEAW